MTLNITLASSWLMLQSSDMRLTRNDLPVSEVAQKLVVLHYKNWSGLLCYSGIAKLTDHDTEQWLSHILTHAPEERTVKDVLNLLVQQGNQWIAKVPPSIRRHTFTLAAYIDGKPQLHTISNFHWTGGRQFPQQLAKFRIDSTKPKRPKCIVTGSGKDVIKPEQQRHLEIALASTTILSQKNLEQIRHVVAETSLSISRNPQAKNTVGEACIVAHLLPDGSGEAQVFGNTVSEFMPTLITHGHNMKENLPEVLQQVPDNQKPHRLVGVTWTSNREISAMFGAYRAIDNQTGDGWTLPSGK